jgi:subtilase family serine protease
MPSKKKKTRKSPAPKTPSPRFKTVSSIRREPTASAIPAPPLVSIQVLLAPEDSSASVLSTNENISSANVHNFRPSKATQDQAAARLANLGFKILSIDPHSISAEGSPSLFSSVFGTQLEIQSIHRVQGSRPTREKAFYAARKGSGFEVPTELKGLVEGAFVQRPSIYLESPLPPPVNYFHLEVPGHVAMLTRASEVHHQGITGKGIRVAMIDSGFFKHPFYSSHGYSANVILAPGAVGVEDDVIGHGTAHSANVFATAPGVSFVMVKQGNDATAAFNAAVALQPHIIVCSWAFDLALANRKHFSAVPAEHKSLELAIAHAVDIGITVVCAAGNGHVAFPGMHPDVISVGGVFVNQNNQLLASNFASAFSSKPYPGRHVPDVCGLCGLAPAGIYLMLPVPAFCQLDKELASGKPFPNGDQTLQNDGWATFSGTSAAAPQVAGVCALLKQKRPNLRPSEIKQLLAMSARDCVAGNANPMSNEGVPVQAGAGIDGATGAGLIDAAEAVKIA